MKINLNVYLYTSYFALYIVIDLATIVTTINEVYYNTIWNKNASFGYDFQHVFWHGQSKKFYI